MRDRKDRTRMSEEFRIKETIDANGHRVIVYEFFGTGQGRTRRKKKNGNRASFIKVTFEGTGTSTEEITDFRGPVDPDVFISRGRLGRPEARS